MQFDAMESCFDTGLCPIVVVGCDTGSQFSWNSTWIGFGKDITKTSCPSVSKDCDIYIINQRSNLEFVLVFF